MFLARGDEVLSIDNFDTGHARASPRANGLTQIEGSIADKRLIEGLISDFRPDVIVHTAASYKDPDDWYSDTMTNSVGGSNLINSARECNVGRFIYFQTALCYGTKTN